MTVNLAQLRALLAVADTGGFSTAAQELAVSQSAVSHAVAALERALGAPVVHRDAPVRPTALGDQILPHARAAVVSAEAVTAIASRLGRAPAGTVRLAAPQTVCQGLLPDLLTRWAAAHPRIRVRIFEGEDDEIATWLESGTADAAVVVDPEPALPGSRLLAHDAFHVVLRRDHPLAGEAEIDVRDLEDDPFLLSLGGCERRIREIFRGAGARFAPVHRIRELGTLISMVRAGIGVSVVPGLARPMLSGDLVLVPLLRAQRVHRRLVLSGPASRPWLPSVSALAEATEEVQV
jgi:DNA-binding transcriptional LysR family regulator